MKFQDGMAWAYTFVISLRRNALAHKLANIGFKIGNWVWWDSLPNFSNNVFISDRRGLLVYRFQLSIEFFTLGALVRVLPHVYLVTFIFIFIGINS